MRIRLTSTLAAGLLAAGTFLAGARLAALPQEPAQDPGKAEAMAGLDPQAMARMMELATPGPEHEQLQRMVGRWQDSFQMRMAPEAPWLDMQLETKVSSLLGGRFTVSKVRGAFMGMPFEGVQILGYDKLAKEFVSTWMDTQGTWMTHARGKASEDGREIVLHGTMRDIAGERPFKQVMRMLDDDHAEMEMYDTIPPHGEVLVMKGSSTRIAE